MPLLTSRCVFQLASMADGTTDSGVGLSAGWGSGGIGVGAAAGAGAGVGSACAFEATRTSRR